MRAVSNFRNILSSLFNNQLLNTNCSYNDEIRYHINLKSESYIYQHKNIALFFQKYSVNLKNYVK